MSGGFVYTLETFGAHSVPPFESCQRFGQFTESHSLFVIILALNSFRKTGNLFRAQRFDFEDTIFKWYPFQSSLQFGRLSLFLFHCGFQASCNKFFKFAVTRALHHLFFFFCFLKFLPDCLEHATFHLCHSAEIPSLHP